MRIACLQFAPQVGDLDNNLNRADSVLSRANPKDLDLLVLPELAFTGYNFKSLHHISPYLEPSGAGITALWARTTALKYNCVVTAGYPEKVDMNPKWPTGPEYYNSAITVNPEGETIANYRKSFLYYTDETWALEGPDGFYGGSIEGLGDVAMGICMDLNPYKFEAPWNAWEFSYHVLHRKANLVILSMAWLTREDPRAYSRAPKEPDMETLSYWLARLEPIIRAETVGEIIVVMANRTGTEDEATYAGTSCVLGIQSGEVKVYGILGRGERELLVVDTDRRPQAKLVSEPNSAVSHTSNTSSTAPSISTADTKESFGTNITTPTAHSPGVRSPRTPENNSFRPEIGAPNHTSDSSPIDVQSPDTYVASKTRRSSRASLNDSRKPSNKKTKKVLKQPESFDSQSDSHSPGPDEGIVSIAHHTGQVPISEPVQSPIDKDEVVSLLVEVSNLQYQEFPKSTAARKEPKLVTEGLSEEAILEAFARIASPRSRYGSRSVSPSSEDSPTLPRTLTDQEVYGSFIRPESEVFRQSGRLDTPLQEQEVQVEEPASQNDVERLKPGLRSSPLPVTPQEPYQTSFTTASFGPRSHHTSPRPRSNMW